MKEEQGGTDGGAELWEAAAVGDGACLSNSKIRGLIVNMLTKLVPGIQGNYV